SFRRNQLNSMSTGMKCNLRTQDQVDILEISGEVDMQYSPAVREKILESVDKGRTVLIDLAEVSYIDSSGIASLIEGLQAARKANLPYGLLRVSDAATQVLSLTRLDNVFPMYDSLDEFISRDQP
ncbi:MAG: STAS domain-containing protein, partial [Pseudohongiellaceae bacterium]